MKKVEMSDECFMYIQTIIVDDFNTLAENPEEYFKQCPHINPISYIEERITNAKVFDLDLWHKVQLHLGNLSYERLKAIYEGRSMKEFYATYEDPIPKLFRTL